MILPEYDVAVVGAGPAGAACARDLAFAGRRTLLIDKVPFPRAKPCGGGVIGATTRALAHAIDEVVERSTAEVSAGFCRDGVTTMAAIAFDRPFCRFVRRERFDAFNLAKAVEAGAEFRVVPGVGLVEGDEEGVTLAAPGFSARASFVVGADGANSAVRRLTRPKDGFYRSFAIEGLVDYSRLGREPVAEFLFGFVENGYGWVFPKADHANVGIVRFAPGGAFGKAELERFARERLGVDGLRDVVGFPCGSGGGDGSMPTERIMLVGDAAGLCKPLLGEGLHFAVQSGRTAAACIDARLRGEWDSLRDAEEASFGDMRNEVVRQERVKRVFYRSLSMRTVHGLLSAN